jgi:acyl-CoA thioesterase
MSGVPASHDHDDARSTPAADAAAHEPTRFATDTGVQRVDGGRYRARMDPSWWIVNGPNGGYVAAVVLRAIVAEVDDPSRRPRSVTLQYLRAPVEGPVEVLVEVERSGRTVTNVSARMVQGGRTVVLALAALAVDRDAPVSFDEGPGLPTMPDGSPVPMPEQVPLIDVDADRDVPMRQHWELRWVLGDRPFHPDPGRERRARSGGWLRPAEPEPIDEIVLVAMADAWVPPVFSRVDTPMAVPTIDLTVHFRGRPADPFDPLLVVFDSPLAQDGYMVEHGRVLDRTGRLIAESRQLAVLA